MKKIYISLPITGIEERARKDAAAFKALLQEHLPEDDIKTPFDICTEKDKPYPFYLAKDIEYLMGCDLVVFMKDWQYSKGCEVEHYICEVYGIKKSYQMAIEYRINRNEPALTAREIKR